VLLRLEEHLRVHFEEVVVAAFWGLCSAKSGVFITTEKGSNRNLKFIVLLAALVLLSTHLVVAQTVIYSVQDGHWSDPATWWGHQVPNCDFVVVKTSVVLDQNVGTNCGGSKWVRVEDTGTLTADNSQPRTIAFASTGTDPIGSGSPSNPGSDATMFGIMVSGVLDLEGTSGNWITLTSYNDTSPIYIHHQANDYVGCTMIVNNVCNGQPAINGAVLRFRYINARHLGTAIEYYEGLFWDMRSGTTPANALDVQFCQFTDLNQIATEQVLSLGGFNFSSNTITAQRGDDALAINSGQTATGWVIADNTEIEAATEGFLVYFIGTPANLTFARNAVLGTEDVQRGLLRIALAAGNGNNSIANNFCYDPRPNYQSQQQCILYGGSPADASSAITGNVLLGSMQPIAVLSGSLSILNNWADEFDTAAIGQGDVIVYGNAVNAYVAYNIQLLESDNANILSLMISDGMFLTAQVEHNTYVGMGSSKGLYLGEGVDPGLAVYNSYARSNLIVGGDGGLVDGNPKNTWSSTASYNGAGAHHNDVYNSSTPYPQPNGPSIGFDDGVHKHPDARYGDITANPVFVAPTRRPPGFDASLGGPGTVDHLFSELSLRNGFGGSYDPRYNIQAMLTWLRAGFSPQNQFLKGRAHDGKDIGAMPVVLSGVQSHN
jgi:hypothetical protein